MPDNVGLDIADEHAISVQLQRLGEGAHVQMPPSVCHRCHGPYATDATAHMPQMPRSIRHRCHGPYATDATAHMPQMPRSIRHRCHSPYATDATIRMPQMPRSIRHRCHGPCHCPARRVSDVGSPIYHRCQLLCVQIPHTFSHRRPAP